MKINYLSTNQWPEYCLLAILAFLWGGSYLLIKVAVESIPPITLIAIRVSIAAIFLIIVMDWKDVHFPKDWRTWRMLFLQSILNSVGAWTLLAWGQQYVDSGLASVLNSTSPVFVFLLTLFITRHEPSNGLKLLGACLGVTGVALIVGADVLNGLGQQVMAQLAILAGAILYAGAAIYGKNFSHLSPTITAAGTMICASLCLIPISIVFDQPWTLQPSLLSIIAALILGVLCTGVALMIYFRLVNTLGSMGVASQSYLRAGIGVFLGVFILGEQITVVVGLGIATALSGVIAINWPRKKI